MKINNSTQHISGGERINLWLPQSWGQLTDSDLLWLFDLMRHTNRTHTELKTLAFIHFAGVRLLEQTPQGWLYTTRTGLLRRSRGWLHAWQVRYYISLLNYLTDEPRQAVQVAQIDRYYAVNAELHDVAFETYLMCENLYQGYIATKRPECLQRMAQLLYVDRRGRQPNARRWRKNELFAVFFWWYSLKCVYSARFPHFFRRVESADGAVGKTPDMTAIMNAEIRALTGGDVTKETQVFALDAYRALTELNEKAREARELNERMSSRK